MRNVLKVRCFGFSMVEVLISLIVMSASMLSVLGLQLNAKRVNYDAVQRTLASILTQSVVEKMRANANSLDSYVATLGGGSIEVPPTPSCLSPDSGCTSTQVAAHDLWDWEQAIDGNSESRSDSSGSLSVGGLVNPTACISHNGGIVTITIAWYGSVELGSPSGNSCGEGLGRYGDSDVNRQIFTLTTFIDNSL